MNRFSWKPIIVSLAIAQSATAQSDARAPSAVTEPQHLAMARWMVANLDLNNTDYELGGGTVTFTPPCVSRTDCSGFADALLTHSYGYDADQFRKWFGSGRPSARRYHDAIERQKGFARIEHMQDVLPGDFLAIKYLNRKDNTGHVMLVANRPQRSSPTSPLEPGTAQWKVSVIDSSESGHGPTDTRHKKGANGKDHTGLGEGVFRIYSDPGGKIAGFTWSTLASSKYVEPNDEDLVVGRLERDSQK
jgi:hypothetical protein